MSEGVAAVIVTYEPHLCFLEVLIRALQQQCAHVILVDNGSISDDQGKKLSQFLSADLVLLGLNKGIAAAHNKGIERARSLNYKYVLLMDQDSLPDDDMVANLLKAETALLARGKNVAAVGPRHVDSRSEHGAPFISSGVLGVKKNYGHNSADAWCAADFLISSGSLISLEVLDRVGGMEESLFIDCVDIEWGYRAASKGYQCFGVYDASMKHAIGDDPVSLLGGRQMITIHSPLRHYYFYRNLIAISKRPYIKSVWKYNALMKSIVQFVFFSTMIGRRSEHFKMILKGVYHGLINKLGKLEV